MLLASSGVVSASNVEMLSRLCFCSMRCVRSSMDTVSISPILSALESSDKMLLYGVSKHLIGRLTRKPCGSLTGIFTTVCVVSSLPGFSSRSGLTGILELASP